MSDTKATVPISGRVAEDDYLFLMEYPISGKVTASEKLRYLVSFFRSYHESLNRFEDSLAELNRVLEPARKDIKRAEVETGVSSELIDRLMQLVPEAMAHLITARIPKETDEQLAALQKLEERLLKNATSLMESVLRMRLTTHSPTYNPHLLRNRFNTIHELVDMGGNNSPQSKKPQL